MVWRVYGGCMEGARRGKGGGKAGARWLRGPPPVCHFGTEPPSCSKCQPVIDTPKKPSRHSSQKNAVESTQGRKGAKTQGFRLLGAFTFPLLNEQPQTQPQAQEVLPLCQ